jgi:hypothetical protein
MYNAQAKQDIFVNKILNKDSGYFIDIGAGTGGLKSDYVGFYSNTYYFESRGWTGIAIDYDKKYIESVKSSRNCKCICVDLMKANINDILKLNQCPEEIDYISIDVDDAQSKVFNEFDFDTYKFKVLTLEHNLFQSFDKSNHTEEHKLKILQEHKLYRQKLLNLGYKILWGNVILDGYGPLEDWYVNEKIYEKFKHLKSENINCSEIMKI